MLQLTKKDVGFLSLYNFCVDTRTQHSDKIKISSIEGSSDVSFCQINSKNVIVITTLKDKNKQKDKFCYIFNTQELYRMCMLCSDDDFISISKDGVSFGAGSTYKFESYDNIKDIYNDEKIKSFAEKKLDSIEIKDFSAVKNIEFCIGVEGYNNIAILRDDEKNENYFVTSDGTFTTGAMKSNGVDVKEDVFIDSFLYKMVKTIDKEFKDLVVEINNEEGYYRYRVDTTCVIVPFVESQIINIFKKDMKEMYEHKNCVSFKKDDFIKALERIAIVTKSNLKNRIFINLEKNNIMIENKDGVEGKEFVDAKVDVELKDKYFITSVFSILKTIKEINGDSITMRIDSDIDNMNVLKVEAEGNDKFFILAVMEK